MIRLSRSMAATEDDLIAAANHAATPVVFPVEELALAADNAAYPDTPLTAAVPAGGTTAFDRPSVTFAMPDPQLAAAATALCWPSSVPLATPPAPSS